MENPERVLLEGIGFGDLSFDRDSTLRKRQSSEPMSKGGGCKKKTRNIIFVSAW